MRKLIFLMLTFPLFFMVGCGIEPHHPASHQTPPPDYKVDPDETDPSTLGPGKTVFVGDSIIRLGDWSLWFPGTDTANQGIGGNTIEDVSARIDPILASNPARIFLAVGVNDLGLGFPVENTCDAYQKLVVHIRTTAPNVQLFCVSVLPVGHNYPLYWPMSYTMQDTMELNSAIQIDAQTNGATFVNTWSSFAGPDDWAIDGLTSGSAIHLSQEGYAVLVQALSPYVNQAPQGNG